MNTMVRRAMLITLGMFFIIPGCNDAYEVTTTINPDGTCERIITCTRESRNLPHGAFPLPTDASWDTSWTTAQKEGESQRYTFTSRKRFPSLDSLNSEVSRPRDSASFHITLEADRKFRWFYTYYTYRETYARFNPFVRVPPDSVLSAEDLHRFMTDLHPDSLLQEKWKAWDDRNQMEFLFLRLVDAVSAMQDPILPASVLMAHRAAIFNAWKKADENPEPKEKKEKSRAGTKEEDEVVAKLLPSMAGILGADAARRIGPALESAVQAWTRASEVAGRARGSYKLSAVMPGTLIESNAGTVEGNRATWEFSRDQLATLDIVMTAESRVVNFWLFLVTAVAVLTITAAPLASRVVHRMRKE